MSLSRETPAKPPNGHALAGGWHLLQVTSMSQGEQQPAPPESERYEKLWGAYSFMVDRCEVIKLWAYVGFLFFFIAGFVSAIAVKWLFG